MPSAQTFSWEKQTLKLRNPFRLSYGVTEERQSFWLRVRDDEGWGEASIPPYYRVDAGEMIACWERANASDLPLPETVADVAACGGRGLMARFLFVAGPGVGPALLEVGAKNKGL